MRNTAKFYALTLFGLRLLTPNEAPKHELNCKLGIPVPKNSYLYNIAPGRIEANFFHLPHMLIWIRIQTYNQCKYTILAASISPTQSFEWISQKVFTHPN